MGEMLIRFFNAIATDIVSIVIYSIIAIAFVVAIMKCVQPLNKNARILNRASRQLERDGAKGTRKKSWQVENFLGDGSMQPHWRQFLNNVFFADSGLQTGCSVEDYINEDTAITAPGKMYIAELTPNIMTSLGILGTFMGLSMGLRGISFQSSDDIIKSVMNFLPNIQVAFNTSIVGVTGAIAFNIIHKSATGNARAALANFLDTFELESAIPTVDPMTQITCYQQEQTVYLKTIAEVITNTLIERIDTQLARNLEPMRTSMDNFIHVATRQQVEGVDRIVTKFIAQMNQTLGGQFTELGETIRETNRWQKQSKETMDQAIYGIMGVAKDVTAIQTASNQIITRFETYLSKLTDTQSLSNDGYEKLSKQIEYMQGIAKDQASYLNELQNYQDKLRIGMESYQKTTVDFMKNYGTTTEVAATTLHSASEHIASNAKLLQNSYESFVVNIEKGLDRTFDLFDENMVGITKQLSTVIAGIRDNVDEVPKLLEQSARSYSEQIGRFLETVNQLQDSLDATMLAPKAMTSQRRRAE